jgi:predicted RNA binding protein YcfA (HicA-like mRNA interferase family)
MPPLLAGSHVVRALEKAGFKVVRIRGSHHVLRHPDGRGTSVPVHGNQDVRVGTLRGILRDCGRIPELAGLMPRQAGMPFTARVV